MKQIKRTNLKFKEYAQNQVMLIPPTLDEMIEANHPVRIVNQVIDRIDLDPLIAKFKGGGTSSYHPRILLKILVFGYLSNIYSGRRMEAALKENIHFMWISGMNRPDYNTINRFRSARLKGVLKQVFGQVVELLAAEGLVNLKVLYVDGTKIESKANRYTFVWGKSIKVSKERIKKQLEELWQYTQDIAQEELKDPSPTTFGEIDGQKVTDTVNKINEALKDKPVSKKVSQKLKYAEKNWPKNLQRYDEQEKILNGYMPDTVTADAGYGSESNYLFLEENLIRAFVKDNYFDKDQKGVDNKHPFVSDHLYYNEAQDCYYCPMGQPMTRQGSRRRTGRDGLIQTYTCYQAQNCQGCPLRGMCHKTSGNRIIEVNHQLRLLKKQARENLLSEEGIKHRKQRPCDVEPVFGNIKFNKGFKRFMLKGCDKVEIEAGLISIAHNLKKWSC
jgi:transposase